MSGFQNTIDLLGDEVVANALINRTITEFNDNVITKVGDYAFYQATSLASANFPSVTSVGSYAFHSCSNLTSIDLPSVTSVGNYAFRSCSNLTSINLPSVTSVGSSVFNGCSKLSCVILRAETVCALSNANAFTVTYFASGKAGGTLLVPRALVEEYKVATNWSVVIAWNENNRVLALEDYTVDGTITGAIDLDKLNGGN